MNPRSETKYYNKSMQNPGPAELSPISSQQSGQAEGVLFIIFKAWAYAASIEFPCSLPTSLSTVHLEHSTTLPLLVSNIYKKSMPPRICLEASIVPHQVQISRINPRLRGLPRPCSSQPSQPRLWARSILNLPGDVHPDRDTKEK